MRVFLDGEPLQDAIVRQRFVSLIAGIVLYVTLELGITFGSSPAKLFEIACRKGGSDVY